jgi:RHS repeat-associated protein
MPIHSRSALSIRWNRLFVGSLVNIVMVSGLAVPVSAAVAEAPQRQPTPPPTEKLDDDGGPVTGRAWTQEKVRNVPAAAPVWPTAAVTRVDLSAGSSPSTRAATATRRAKAGDLPVWIADAPKAAGSARLSRVDVKVVDRAEAPAAWRDGMLLQVTAPQGAATGTAQLSVDYRAFQQAYGADWASRLKLWQVPSCAFTSPESTACRSTPLPSAIDVAAGTVSATVPVDLAGTPAAVTRSANSAPSASFVALSAGASGDSGDFTATSLAASSTWSAGGNSGEFSWNYPMRVPPATGPTPDVSLSYSSASVDGRSEVTNNQPSWIGEGFDYTPGFIERRYVPCSQDSKDNANSTKYIGDLCWRSDNATISLGGSSTELIYQSGKGWHGRTEDGSKVEKLAGAGNGDTGTVGIDGVGEHWKVTNADGTQYFFGLDDLPGETAPTNSTLTVPVFGNHTGEPCHQSSFLSSDCVQAYRWNLDYVVDVRGNTMSYWYGKDTNKYAQNATASEDSAYDRAGYLTRVDYGTYDRTQTEHGVTERNTTPYAQVEFVHDVRCFTNCGTEANPTTANWQDTPWDQECKASATSCPDQFSPTFWSTKRLKTVITRVWDTTVTPAKWQDVDSWTLSHTFSATADSTHTGLWLQKIDHAGLVSDTVSRPGLVGPVVNLPPVTFEAESLPNRVVTDNTSSVNWLRLSSIVTEAGAKIKVDYSKPDCTAAIVKTLKAHTNTRRCYPVRVPSNADPGGDVMVEEWWHKYVVEHIAEDDMQTTGNLPTPSKHTRYEYMDDPAWHYADDDGLVPANRKTWDQWRGYAEVHTTVGDETDTRTLTVTKFMRGMHDDRATPSGGKRPVTVPATIGTGTVYDHDQFAGMVREQTTYNGVTTKPVSKTVNVPWRSNPLASRSITDSTGYTDIVESRYVNTQATYASTALGVDGSRGWRTSAAHTDFDHTYGTANWSQDDGDINKPDDQSCTTYTYNRNIAKNLTGTVSRTLTTALNCGEAPTSVDDVISDSRVYYDGAASVTTSPKYGAVTKTEQLKDWTPGSGTQWQTTSQATYDFAGRAKSTTDIKNNISNVTYTPAVGGPVTKVTTDNVIKWTSTSTETWSSTVETNPYWGSIIKSTDPNKRITADVDYDGLGRVARVWKLGWTRAVNPTKPSAQYEYKLAANRNAYPYVTSQTLNARANYVTSYQISDAMMRPRQTQTLSLGGSGARVVTDTIYDAFGRVATTYSPHAETGAPSGTLWVEPEWSVPSITRTVYDRASRPTASIFLSGNNIDNLVEKWRTTTAYEGDLTKVTPPEGGTPTTTLTDIQGRVTKLRQHTTIDGVNGAYTETSYTFNRKGQQIKVADADGNEWTNAYDVKGRLDYTTDPDKGSTDYGYNDFNELESTIDGRDEKIWYVYDVLGRKKQARDDAKDGPLRASWSYDTLFDDTTGYRGQLTQATRYEPAGSPNAYKWQVRSFNARYQPTGVNYVIPPVETGLNATYVYGYDYAPATGDPTALSYPAGGGLVTEQLTTTYNAGTGMPESLNTSLTGWAGNMASAYYTAYGERSGSVYQMLNTPYVADNVYHDEWTRRITRTTVERKTAAGNVSDRNYDYDKAGNILSIEDKAVGAAEKQCFRTDALGRLTRAWTPKTTLPCTTDPTTVADLGGPAPYWQDWTFTTTGSRETETTHAANGNTVRDYTIPTGGPNVVRPHAATAMNTTTGQTTNTTEYQYDDGGNMICRPTVGSTTNDCTTKTGSQTLNWDAEGELANVTAGGSTIEASVYDANGERLIRRDATGTTLYLPGQEIRRENGLNTGTRYYNFAGTTFASRTATSDITGLTWLLNDHQGTHNIAINAGTQAVTTRRQTPYGNERGTSPMWVNKKSFVGGDQDTTGLINIGARRYDPILGRFISVDPLMDLADPQQWNGYNYANNTPITASDPTGLKLACGPGHDTPCPKGPSTPPQTTPGGGGTPSGGGPSNGTHGNGDIADTPVKVTETQRELFKDRQFGGDNFTLGTVADYASKSNDNWYLVCVQLIDPSDASQCSGANPFAAPRTKTEEAIQAGKILIGVLAPLACAAFPSGCAAIALDAVAGEATFAGTGALVSTGGAGMLLNLLGKSGRLASVACSFSGDTEVLLADGTTKPLSEVVVGDEVLATDPETGEQGARQIEKVWIHNDDLYVLTVNGERLVTTEDHPFWNESSKEWQPAEQLDQGDFVRAPAGTAVVGKFDKGDQGYAGAYNLTVAGLHTYYVMAGVTPVLVHNTCGPAFNSAMSARNHYLKHAFGVALNPKGKFKTYVAPSNPEFNGVNGFAEYKRAASDLMGGPFRPNHPDDHLTSGGSLFRRDPATGNFGILNSGGSISTFFRPDNLGAYWDEQLRNFP